MFPRTTSLLATTFVTAPYIYECYKFVKEDDTKKQLRYEIQRNCKQALKYSTQNAYDIKSGKTVNEQYRKDSLNLLIRQFVPITLLGENYVIGSWRNKFGWLIRQEDYSKLMDNLKIVAFNDKIDENFDLLEDLKKDTHNELNTLIEDKVNTAWTRLK
jgi:hypothetical protein